MHIKVKVLPESKKELITQTSPDRFLVQLKEKKERNLANQRLLKVMAGFLGVPPRKVRILSGHHYKNKIIEIID